MSSEWVLSFPQFSTDGNGIEESQSSSLKSLTLGVVPLSKQPQIETIDLKLESDLSTKQCLAWGSDVAISVSLNKQAADALNLVRRDAREHGRIQEIGLLEYHPNQEVLVAFALFSSGQWVKEGHSTFSRKTIDAMTRSR